MSLTKQECRQWDPVHFPEKHFPERTVPKKIFGRMDISPNAHFPERTISRM